MTEIAFRQEEGLGLAAAIIAHAALLAFLVLRPVGGDIVKPPERIAVSLSDEVGLVAASPQPAADAAPDLAPTIGDAPPSEPEVAEPAPVRPTPVVTPPRPRPTPARVVERRPQQDLRPRRRPDRPSPPSRAQPPQRSGGSRLGNDFLEGVTNSDRGSSTSAPAAAFGPREQASLAGAITRQLRPHWSAPSGVDVEQLVSVVSWQLNRDGSLRGRPRCVDQRGITESNRPQALLHCERAIRAVQLAAPFNLPEQFYSRWDDLEWDFDRRL